MLGNTRAAKQIQRARDVALTRTRADALMKASEDPKRTLIERVFMEVRAIELRDMADVLDRAVIG